MMNIFQVSNPEIITILALSKLRFVNLRVTVTMHLVLTNLIFASLQLNSKNQSLLATWSKQIVFFFLKEEIKNSD